MLLHSLPSHLLLAINVFRTQPLADRLPPVRKLLAIIAVRNRHTNFVPHVSTGAPEFFKEVFGGVKRKVGARGFEPPTFRSRTERATRLRYAPINQTTCESILSGARLTVKHALTRRACRWRAAFRRRPCVSA